MRVMSELMLIEETMERASARVQSMLTLVQLSFEAGAAKARQIHEETGRVIDPVASALYEEARSLLLLPYPQFMPALGAAGLAAGREPECYGLTHKALEELLWGALEDTVDNELAAMDQATNSTSLEP